MTTSRNIIIAAATGYKAEDIWPFLQSLGKYCPDAELVLLGDKRIRADWKAIEASVTKVHLVEVEAPGWQNVASQVVRHPLARRLRKLIKLKGRKAEPSHHIHSDKRPAFDLKSVPSGYDISVSRIFHALRWLAEQETESGKVLLTDCRDVVFQSDPFAEFDGSVGIGVETVRIGSEPFTSKWIEQMYGAKGVDKCRGQPVLCSGVMMGHFNSIKQLLETCWSEALRTHKTFGLRRGFDQGILNFLVYGENRIPGITPIPKDSPILVTMDRTDEDRYEWRSGQICLKEASGAPAIVHQYDRILLFRNKVLELYPYSG